MQGIGKTENIMSLIIDNHLIVSENFIKMLGVNFDEKLNFNIHISEICKKARQTIECVEKTVPIS